VREADPDAQTRKARQAHSRDVVTDGETRVRASRTIVFDVPCFRGTLEEATALVVDAAAGDAGGYACLCNVHVLETARRDALTMAALRGARLVFPDGAPLTWVQRRAASGPAERVGGPDLMEEVVHAGCAVGLRHALYGSTEAVLDMLKATLERRYPLVQIVASIAPPFGARSDEEVARDIEDLRSARPNVIWVALGAPRQERWAATYAPALAPAFVIGVGAAFEFIGGTKPRAPRWMREASLEWLHRLLTEPRRLGLRYLTTNSRFLVRAGVGLVRQSAGRSRAWN